MSQGQSCLLFVLFVGLFCCFSLLFVLFACCCCYLLSAFIGDLGIAAFFCVVISIGALLRLLSAMTSCFCASQGRSRSSLTRRNFTPQVRPCVLAMLVFCASSNSKAMRLLSLTSLVLLFPWCICSQRHANTAGSVLTAAAAAATDAFLRHAVCAHVWWRPNSNTGQCIRHPRGQHKQ